MREQEIILIRLVSRCPLIGRSSLLLIYYIMLDPMSLRCYDSSTRCTCHVVVFRHHDSVEQRSTKCYVVVVHGIFAYKEAIRG